MKVTDEMVEAAWTAAGPANKEGVLDMGAAIAAAIQLSTAPDLLAALEAIVFQVVQGPVLERDACITQARAAIAKATAP